MAWGWLGKGRLQVGSREDLLTRLQRRAVQRLLLPQTWNLTMVYWFGCGPELSMTEIGFKSNIRGSKRLVHTNNLVRINQRRYFILFPLIYLHSSCQQGWMAPCASLRPGLTAGPWEEAAKPFFELPLPHFAQLKNYHGNGVPGLVQHAASTERRLQLLVLAKTAESRILPGRPPQGPRDPQHCRETFIVLRLCDKRGI